MVEQSTRTKSDLYPFLTMEYSTKCTQDHINDIPSTSGSHFLFSLFWGYFSREMRQTKINNKSEVTKLFQLRKRKKEKKRKVRICGKRNLGKHQIVTFWFYVDQSTPYPRLHGTVDEQHRCHSHRHLTDRITVFRVCRFDLPRWMTRINREDPKT